MLTAINPKLPMRSKSATQEYYTQQLGFMIVGDNSHDFYLMLEKDNLQIHFFLYENLIVKENFGQIYLRTDDIEALYKSLKEKKVAIHPNGTLQIKPWGQKEFSLLDPDSNLLTFGEAL